MLVKEYAKADRDAGCRASFLARDSQSRAFTWPSSKAGQGNSRFCCCVRLHRPSICLDRTACEESGDAVELTLTTPILKRLPRQKARRRAIAAGCATTAAPAMKRIKRIALIGPRGAGKFHARREARPARWAHPLSSSTARSSARRAPVSRNFSALSGRPLPGATSGAASEMARKKRKRAVIATAAASFGARNL